MERVILALLCFTVLTLACAPKRTVTYQSVPTGTQKVVASWYGPEFHGRPTASGEIFNMYEYTCAHREYPFGTKLRVLNPKNQREVVCTVNDRGPFVPGRDLDLSYASAKRIDMLGDGVAEVLIEPIGRDLSYVRTVRYSTLQGILTLQVGAFIERDNALRLKRALMLKYSDVYITKAKVRNELFYRVRIGRFTDYSKAHELAKALAEEGYHVMITNYEAGGRDEI